MKEGVISMFSKVPEASGVGLIPIAKRMLCLVNKKSSLASEEIYINPLNDLEKQRLEINSLAE